MPGAVLNAFHEKLTQQGEGPGAETAEPSGACGME